MMFKDLYQLSMFLLLVQPLIPYQGRRIYIILSAVLLLQQRHPLGLAILGAAGDAVQVNAAGYSGTRDVGAVPHRLIASCRLHLIHQSHHFLSQKVVHGERYVRLLGPPSSGATDTR